MTAIELVERYRTDLVLFAAFAYGLYRLTLRPIGRQLPVSLDAWEADDGGQGGREATDGPE